MTVGGELPGEKWNFQVDGRGLFARIYKAENERAALLFAHGFGTHVGRHTATFEFLNQQGVTVYAYDQRGHGRSPGQRGFVDVGKLVADFTKARHAISKATDLPLILAGHSMGGVVAARSALDEPQNLVAAALFSPAFLVGEDKPGWLKTLGNLIAPLAPALPTGTINTALLSSNAAEVARYEQDPLVFHKSIPLKTASTMMEVGARSVEDASTLIVPTLILHGDCDQLASIEGSRAFSAGTPSDGAERVCELVEFAGAVHELENDSMSEQFYHTLGLWLDKVLSPQ